MPYELQGYSGSLFVAENPQLICAWFTSEYSMIDLKHDLFSPGNGYIEPSRAVPHRRRG